MRPWLRRSAALLLQLIGWPFLGLLAAARLNGARRSWLLDFFDTWLLYALLPFPVLAALAAWLRSPGTALLGGLGSVWLAASARGALGKARRPRSVAGPRLRVLTANVLGGNRQPDELAALVARERPDVVALQEVRPGFAEEVARLLAPTHPYADLRPYPRNAGGALFSCWPFEAIEAFRLAKRGAFCQRARLRVQGRAIEVFNIHLDTPFEIYPRHHGLVPIGVRYRTRSVRDVEVDRLLELLAPLEGPLVVLGDFNTSVGSRPYRRLTRVLRDAFAEVGRGVGHTYPQPVSIHGLVLPFALLRIDYCWLKGPVEPLAVRTLPQVGSDHFAVLAELALGEVVRAVGSGSRAEAGAGS